MKLKFSPDTSVALSIFTEKLDQLDEILTESRASLLKMTEGRDRHVANSYGDLDAKNLRKTIEVALAAYASLETQIRLLKSHDAPKVLVEIEL